MFVGPHEHHSNILPWKEAGAETVIIRELLDHSLVLLSFISIIIIH